MISILWFSYVLAIITATISAETMSILDHRSSITSSVSLLSSSSSSDSPLTLASMKCGQILTAKQGIIQTPNFPNKFPVPIKCKWIIDASAIAKENVSITVYFTQQYVLSGLKFQEYAYHSDDYKVPSETSGFEMTEYNVTQVAWVRFHSQYLEITFTMDNLYGTHLRALDHLLDIYGFNITYEVNQIVKENKCNALLCRYLGHCYATQNFS